MKSFLLKNATRALKAQPNIDFYKTVIETFEKMNYNSEELGLYLLNEYHSPHRENNFDILI